jgi:hypothetical protein
MRDWCQVPPAIMPQYSAQRKLFSFHDHPASLRRAHERSEAQPQAVGGLRLMVWTLWQALRRLLIRSSRRAT